MSRRGHSPPATATASIPARHCAGFVFSVALVFKSMIIYRIASNWQSDLQVLEDALQRTVFEECGATQERPVG